jgi:glutaredoxin
MNKKVILIATGIIILLAISTLIAFKTIKPPSPALVKSDDKIILYYGATCPHCLKVEQFMADNKIEEKISITKKEVYNDKNNAAELGEKAHQCGLDTSSIGIPFLWDGPEAKCLVGDEDIINFFKIKSSSK